MGKFVMENLYVLYNLDANVRKSTNVLNRTEQFLQEREIVHKTLISESRDHARAFVRELESNGGGKLVIIGGDGTIHNAVNAITDFDRVSVGFIKGGSANDLCQTLGIKDDPREAMADILSAPEKKMNLIDVSGVKCVNLAATGLDVEVLRRRDRMKLFSGKVKYLMATLATLMKFSSYKFNTIIGDVKKAFNGLMVAVGNGKYFGGGMKAAPHADPLGDEFAVTVVHEVKKRQLPSLLPRFMKGRHDKCKGLIDSYYAKEIDIFAPEEKDFTVNIDGELYKGLDFSCRLLKGKLRVLLPELV